MQSSWIDLISYLFPGSPCESFKMCFGSYFSIQLTVTLSPSLHAGFLVAIFTIRNSVNGCVCVLIISSGLGFICDVRRCILNSHLVDCCLSNGCFIAGKPKLFHRTKLFPLSAYYLILMVKKDPAMIFFSFWMRKKG